MFKSIFKAVAVSAVAAFFCVGCGGDDDDEPDDGGNPVDGGGTKSYTITFNANGGTVSPTSAKTDEDGILASLPTPTRSGYTFDGWYTTATGGTEVTESRVYSANATIYAHWKEGSVGSSYTITFDANDGTVSPTSAKTGDDGKLDSLPEPTRDGYTFDGWYTATTGGTAVTINNVYSANTTIYARWKEMPGTPYTITFDATGGTVSPTSAKTGDDRRLAALPTPTRSGYVFVGWYTTATGGTRALGHSTYSGSRTLYALWIAEESNYTSKGNNIGNYRVVQIGTQKWMAENLDYKVEGSVCYKSSADSCVKYGRLYNWATAMKVDTRYNERFWEGSDKKHQGICPDNWHIPSSAEWSTLLNYVDSSESTAGTKLRSTSGWYDGGWGYAGNGTDEYGFSALPGGGGSAIGDFANTGSYGHWWSATGNYYGDATRMELNTFGGAELKQLTSMLNLLSVRCVAD